MTRFYAPPKFSRQILMPIAGIFLIAATQAALAKNGDHSGDQGDMHSDKHKSKSGEMYSQNGDQNSHKHKDKGGEMYSQNGDQNSHKHKDKGEAKYSEKHKDKSKQYAEKGMGKDKHKTPGNSIASNNPPAPGTGGTNTIHPIPSPVPVASSSGAPAALCVTPPVNTIHPIPSPAPVASSSGGPVAAPVDTIVRDHRHPPAVAGGPQPGVKPDGYTGFEDSTAGGHFWKGVGDFADGLAHGFSAGPAPEDPTGTYTQY